MPPAGDRAETELPSPAAGGGGGGGISCSGWLPPRLTPAVLPREPEKLENWETDTDTAGPASQIPRISGFYVFTRPLSLLPPLLVD